MGHPLVGEEDVAVPGLLAQDELGAVLVEIECKQSTIGPPVLDGPEHGLPTQLIEAIFGINKCLGIWQWQRQWQEVVH